MTLTESSTDTITQPIEQPELVRSSPRERPPSPPPEPDARARWHPPSISRSGWITAGIGGLAAVLYLWNLSKVGYANSYYTAAVKSASVNWKAFFFGSIDPGNFITVDKPPAAIWVQALSVRALGFSSFSMLLPDALAGVGSVLLLHNLVRKWAGNTAAHLAALALAVTPVAVLMFRFNNPDAILTFLCLAATWALWRAVENGQTRWLVLSGTLVGLAFQTKMLQAGLIVPALILTYLIAGPPKLGRRLLQLVAALGAVIVSAGWWVAIVALWPAATRPYIGSTSNNSIISLVFGYNGLSRLFGNSGPGGSTGPGGGGGSGFGGTSGVLRLGNSALGGQIAWLIPLAVAGLGAGLWISRRGRRTDRFRAGFILWGTWALVCAAVFSLSKGVFHPYYTVQLAPAVAALAATGGLALWKVGRTHRTMQWLLPTVVVASAAWAVVLLHRTPTFVAWLPPLIIAGAVMAAVGLWLGHHLASRTMTLVAGVVAAATLLAGPVAYSLTTVAHPGTGSLVAAGPSSSASRGFGGGGSAGGPGQSGTTDTALVKYLEANQGEATYIVAAFGSQSSAPIIIVSGKPVITIGGFNGGDPAPTLAQFEKLVATGQVRYVLVSGGGGFGGGGPGGGTTSTISTWVTSHGKAVTVPGSTATLYDLSSQATAS